MWLPRQDVYFNMGLLGQNCIYISETGWSGQIDDAFCIELSFPYFREEKQKLRGCIDKSVTSQIFRLLTWETTLILPKNIRHLTTFRFRATSSLSLCWTDIESRKSLESMWKTKKISSAFKHNILELKKSPKLQEIFTIKSLLRN